NYPTNHLLKSPNNLCSVKTRSSSLRYKILCSSSQRLVKLESSRMPQYIRGTHVWRRLDRLVKVTRGKLV
ncbi:GSCOCG00001285001-RA-CDS, partial [Cotesia congregata]